MEKANAQDRLFFVRVTQDEMYDLGNIEPITHFILYNQTRGMAVDITSDVKQAPLLSAVPRMQVLPKEGVETIEKLMGEGFTKRKEGEELSVISAVRKFEYNPLEGDKYVPVAETMVRLNQTKSSLDDVMLSFESTLISSGIITPKPVEEERPLAEKVDASKLDTQTRARLESIVGGVQDDEFKRFFYERIGDTEKAKTYCKQVNLSIVREKNVFWSVDALLHVFNEAEAGGIDDEGKKEIAQKLYTLANHDRNYDVALRMARDVLHLPQKTIKTLQEQSLLSAMMSYPSVCGETSEDDGSYSDVLKEKISGLSTEDVRKTATKAYELLMAKGECDRFGGTNYLAAGKLAKTFELGRDNIVEAGRRLVETHLENNYAGGEGVVEAAFKELELPEETVHPVMIRFFQRALHKEDDSAKRIADAHKLTAAEIGNSVVEQYGESMAYGRFDTALRLRQDYSSSVRDEKVSLGDLKTLVGLLYAS